MVFKNADEESHTGLEIDFDENYSLGINDDHFTDCDLIAESELEVFQEQVSLDKKSKCSKQENKLRKTGKHSSDKKKSVKQQCFTCGKVMSSR